MISYLYDIISWNYDIIVPNLLYHMCISYLPVISYVYDIIRWNNDFMVQNLWYRIHDSIYDIIYTWYHMSNQWYHTYDIIVPTYDIIMSTYDIIYIRYKIWNHKYNLVYDIIVGHMIWYVKPWYHMLTHDMFHSRRIPRLQMESDKAARELAGRRGSSGSYTSVNMMETTCNLPLLRLATCYLPRRRRR